MTAMMVVVIEMTKMMVMIMKMMIVMVVVMTLMSLLDMNFQNWLKLEVETNT